MLSEMKAKLVLAEICDVRDGAWFTAMEETKWFNCVSNVLELGRRTGQALVSGRKVLVECQEGRDWSSVVSALAQLYADPFYRTIAGFCVLIEKEFCNFGYPVCSRTF